MSDEPGDVAARIIALEKAVDWLQRDLAQLRQQVARDAPAAEPVPHPSDGPFIIEAIPAPPLPKKIELPPLPPPPARPDLETLVGRYGMLALGALLALAAIGTFVSWAVVHGLLGPVPRVVLGLVAAVALGAFGVWLRPRERSFGNSLLALSLAATHVCAWAAGPGLHLVPPFLALALSAVASVALAGYALVQQDEVLWCVGFGGASAAPFVTSSGHGTAPMLAAYAVAVQIAGGSALGSRAWTIAARLFGAAALLFVAAIATLPNGQHAAELALALPFAVAALGVVPFAHGAVARPRLRTLGLVAAGAGLNVATTSAVSHTTGAIAVALAGVAWLVLVELVDSEPAGTLFDGFGDAGPDVAAWFDGAVIPTAFLLALGLALDATDIATAAFALAAGLLFLFCSRREGSLRDAAALPAFGAALAATLIATRSSHELQTGAASAIAVLFVFLERTVPNRTWRWAPQLVLVLASLAALGAVTVRPSYGYVPFGTSESAVALAVAVAWAVTAARSRDGLSWLLGGIFAFCWVNQELAWAVNPSVSTLLLVGWYAVTGVACVAFGRARAVARIRHVGLGLGVVAALLAMKAAWGLPSTAARISAYLVVSVFLLGIAWWYRQPGPSPVTPPAP